MKPVELGFDPKSKQKQAFVTTITPQIAEYILKYHNKDNRKMKSNQVNSIINNIRKNGWIFDGGALTFNVDGNITEFQHRLKAIIACNLTVEVIVATGVATDSFTKTAAPKARTAVDEIQRKDPSAPDSWITTCREIVTRRQQRPKFNMNTAVAQYKYWKPYIIEGEKLIQPFFDSVYKYSTYRRVFAAWATMLHFYDQDDIAIDFLSLLKDHTLRDKQVRLTKDWEYVMSRTWELSPSDRSAMVYKLLCLCSDRIEKKPSGEIELDTDIANITHDSMKKRGFYRKFLDNPDNIQPVTFKPLQA